MIDDAIADVKLRRSVFRNAMMAGAKFENVSLFGVSIEDANIDGMTIDGVLVSELMSFFAATKKPKA